jgi:hypothetical protein
MVLKKELSRAEQQIMFGRDTTKGILERTLFKEGSALITGFTIFSIGNGHLRTIRKALARLENLPEGDTIHSEGIQIRINRNEGKKEYWMKRIYC